MPKDLGQELHKFYQDTQLLPMLERLWQENTPAQAYTSFEQLVFWHFYFLLPVPAQNLLNSHPQLFKVAKRSLSSLPEYFTLSDIHEAFKVEFLSFISAADKERVGSVLCSCVPLYHHYRESDAHSEAWLFMMAEKHFQGQELHFYTNIAWALSMALYHSNVQLIHAKEAYRLYHYLLNIPAEVASYYEWVQSLKKLSQNTQMKPCQMEFYIEFLAIDPLLLSKFCSYYYPLSSSALTHERLAHNLIRHKTEQISDTDLVNFLYQPRLGKSLVGPNDQLKLFKEMEHFRNLDQSRQDWFAFWEGVKLWEKRRQSFAITRSISRQRLSFDQPEVVAAWFSGIFPELPQESLWCLFVDNKFQLIDYQEVSRGTVNQTIAHPREVFAAAIQHRAVGVILIHNHPSGSAMPSENDRTLTNRIQAAGEIIGIKLMDHLIIGHNQYYSFNRALLYAHTPNLQKSGKTKQSPLPLT